MSNPHEHQSIGSVNQRTDARAQEIADQLIGTARTVHDVMTIEEIADHDLETAINDLMFECDCCGWWASTEELNNEDGQEFDEMCDECAHGGEQ